MALDDILFGEGDKQDFIVEIPLLYSPPSAPVDVVFDADNQLDFVVEFPLGTLNAPLDVLSDNSNFGLYVNELVLTGGTGGESSSGWAV